MQTFSTLLQIAQLVLFAFFIANAGKLIIHLLINDNAND
jgi:hypothetical protein